MSEILTSPFCLRIIDSNKRKCSSQLNKMFPNARIGDYVIDLVTTKKGNEKEYIIVKTSDNEWCYNYLHKTKELEEGK